MEPFKGLEGLAGSDLTAETSDSIQKPPSQVRLPPPRGAFSILVSSRQAIEEFSAQAGSSQGSCGLNSPGPRAGSSDETAQRLWAGRRWDQDSLGGVMVPLA